MKNCRLLNKGRHVAKNIKPASNPQDHEYQFQEGAPIHEA